MEKKKPIEVGWWRAPVVRAAVCQGGGSGHGDFIYVGLLSGCHSKSIFLVTL